MSSGSGSLTAGQRHFVSRDPLLNQPLSQQLVRGAHLHLWNCGKAVQNPSTGTMSPRAHRSMPFRIAALAVAIAPNAFPACFVTIELPCHKLGQSHPAHLHALNLNLAALALAAPPLCLGALAAWQPQPSKAQTTGFKQAFCCPVRLPKASVPSRSSMRSLSCSSFSLLLLITFSSSLVTPA